MKITDIAKAVSKDARCKIIGVRPGEKIHEQMIGIEDALHTYEYDDYYKVLPAIYNWSSDPVRNKGGFKVGSGFVYSSDNNTTWMSIDDLIKWIDENKLYIGNI